MEQKTKKINFKIIIPIVAVVIIAIIGIVLFITISNKKECERLEKEWTEKRVEIGDVCVDMAYYADKIKKVMNEKYPSEDTLKELKNAMNKEIDEKMKHLEDLNKTIGKVKTKAQEQWKEDYYTIYQMNKQRNLIGTRISGYVLISNSKAVIETCDELILIYARSDLRHDEIYSNNEQTIQRFKSANVRERFSEEIEQQTKQYIHEHYFGN